jgi:hypothetical protein
MAIMGSEEGQIVYQMDKFGSYLPFPIYMTEAEQKERLNKLKKEAMVLEKAIEEQDPSLVEGIYNDNEIAWLCNKCPYLEKCKIIRYNEDKAEVSIETTIRRIEQLKNGDRQEHSQLS